jgi:hypothetical protein
MKELKARTTPEATRPARHPSPEKILFFERTSAYSEGSALFITYERDVTSESSLMIP